MLWQQYGLMVSNLKITLLIGFTNNIIPDSWPKSSNPLIYASSTKTSIGGRPPKKRRREVGETKQSCRKLSKWRK